MFRLGVMLLLAALLGVGGCASMEFRDQWSAMGAVNEAALIASMRGSQNDAAARPGSSATPTLEGRWIGEWTVSSPEHGGVMRAIVRRVSDTLYTVTFDSEYGSVLHFVHTADLAVTREADGTLRFTGEENLGCLAGGVFQYKGASDGVHWKSTFRTSGYRGTYEMIRVSE